MNVDGLIEQWHLFARANWMHAMSDEHNNDAFGARLHRARGEVRHAAATMLEQRRDDPKAAAASMQRNATELRQPHWPFVGFDEVALKYTRARTWQDCARAIDPSLPEVQPQWSD